MPVSELGRQRQEQHMFWAMLGCTVRPHLRNQKQSCYLLEVRSSLKTLCAWYVAGDAEGQAVALFYGKCCHLHRGLCPLRVVPLGQVDRKGQERFAGEQIP